VIKFYQSRLNNDLTLVAKLEKEFAEYTGFDYAIAVDSCTNAIALCLYYEQPKEVWIPAMTYVSVANEVLHVCAKLFFEDSCSAGYAYRLKNTKIIDAAHEIVRYGHHTLLNGNDKVCYSFYPTKLIPSYEGGMICTNDREFRDWARTARQMGRDGYGPYYNVVFPGWKYNMTGIQAREALKSLRMLPKTLAVARKQVKLYDKLLKENHTSDHLYITNVPARDKCIEWMKKKGVECSIHFEPIYKKWCYKEYDGEFPLCEKLFKTTISLPLHPFLKEREIRKVARLIKEWRKSWKTLQNI